MRGEEAADQRAGDARDAEHRAEQPHVAAAVARRHDVADRRLRAHHQPAAAQPLDRAERDQLGHPLREPAQRRADEEQDQRALQHDLAPVEVAELAVQRRHRRHRQQVGGDHPRQVLEPAELADDRRQRGRDDRLVQRRQQHHQHQAADDDQDAAAVGGARGHRRSPTPPPLSGASCASRALALRGRLAALAAGRGLLRLRAALARVVSLAAARRLAALLRRWGRWRSRPRGTCSCPSCAGPRTACRPWLGPWSFAMTGPPSLRLRRRSYGPNVTFAPSASGQPSRHGRRAVALFLMLVLVDWRPIGTRPRADSTRRRAGPRSATSWTRQRRGARAEGSRERPTSRRRRTTLITLRRRAERGSQPPRRPGHSDGRASAPTSTRPITRPRSSSMRRAAGARVDHGRVPPVGVEHALARLREAAQIAASPPRLGPRAATPHPRRCGRRSNCARAALDAARSRERQHSPDHALPAERHGRFVLPRGRLPPATTARARPRPAAARSSERSGGHAAREGFRRFIAQVTFATAREVR